MGSSWRARVVVVAVVVALAARSAVAQATKRSDYPFFLLGDGDQAYSLVERNGEVMGNWRMEGGARGGASVSGRLAIGLTDGTPNMNSLLTMGNLLRGPNFDLYYDIHIRNAWSEDRKGEGDGCAMWLSPNMITGTGPYLGAAQLTNAFGILLVPSHDNIRRAKLGFVDTTNRIMDFSIPEFYFSENRDDYCTLSSFDGLKRVFVSFRFGVLKVWVKEIPSSREPYLCFTRSNVAFEPKSLALSGSTSEQRKSVLSVMQVQLRIMDAQDHEERYRHSDISASSEHLQEIDSKFFDLQNALLVSLNQPDANEEFFKDTKLAMETIFDYLGQKELAMSRMHRALMELKEHNVLKTGLDSIEKDSTSLRSDLEFLVTAANKFKDAWNELSSVLTQQTDLMRMETYKHKGPHLFWIFVVSSQIAFAALFYYTRVNDPF